MLPLTIVCRWVKYIALIYWDKLVGLCGLCLDLLG